VGVFAVAVALCLTACQDDDGGPLPGGTAAHSSSPSPSELSTTAEPTAVPSAGGAPGATVVPPGTTVQHEVVDAGGAVLSLTVRSLEATSSCPARGVEVTPIETFVILDVTATLTTPHGTGTPGGEHPSGKTGTPGDVYAALTPDLFRITAPDGRTQQIVATDGSWACLEDDDLLPPFVDLGEAASGKVVLDSASAHGSVVYAPEDAAGWAWEF